MSGRVALFLDSNRNKLTNATKETLYDLDLFTTEYPARNPPASLLSHAFPNFLFPDGLASRTRHHDFEAEFSRFCR